MGIRRYTQLKPNAQHIADFEIDRHSFQKLITTFIKKYLLAVLQVIIWSLELGVSLFDISIPIYSGLISVFISILFILRSVFCFIS